VALKPTECPVERALDLPFDRVVVDFEGHDFLPDGALLRELAAEKSPLLTTPVRADGFDPLGDDSKLDALPDGVGRVVVAGNPTYLSDAEGSRAVAPRLAAARERDPSAWVGTEGVERVALAVGGPQFELLSRTTPRDVRALRATGFEADVAVYAPTVLADDEDVLLDALGPYLGRRRPVDRALPDDPALSADATGRTREILLRAADDYALVGTAESVRERVAALEAAGVDTVVGYPARGVDDFLG
jgi:alkanesulfonate monooxygenase SsuD/methylene tetrahydromethanopterin reductase-like flavin-dependent oxidoreductase (luciferase family)